MLLNAGDMAERLRRAKRWLDAATIVIGVLLVALK
jgi:hypothetical protein